MERRALLRWLLATLRGAGEPFATDDQVALLAGNREERVDAIEVRILGRHLRITVEDLG